MLEEPLERQFAKKLGFGVGCFHFGPTKELDEKDHFQNYAEMVKNYLESYPNISDIVVEDIGAIRIGAIRIGGVFNNSDDHFSLNNAQGIYPWPVNWNIKFKVHIPKRIIEEISSKLIFRLVTQDVEDIVVYLNYSGGFPVCFILAPKCSAESPSDLVILIREYLWKFKPIDDRIKLLVLGPSPFHADFFLEGNDETGSELIRSFGYDRIYIYAESDSDLQKILEAEQFSLTRELSIFYELVQLRNRLMERWREIEEELESFVEKAATRRWWHSFTSAFTAPTFNKLMIEIIQFNLEAKRSTYSLERDYQRLANELSVNRIKRYVEEEALDIRSYYDKDYVKIMNHLGNFESTFLNYRMGIVTGIITLAAAVAGGIAGAIATMMLSTP